MFYSMKNIHLYNTFYENILHTSQALMSVKICIQYKKLCILTESNRDNRLLSYFFLSIVIKNLSSVCTVKK